MSKFTPGPWQWGKRDGDYIDSLWGGPNGSQNVVSVNEECRSETDRFSFLDMYEDDARLIEQAPRLLKALESLCGENMPTRDDFDEAREAIKAANGG